MTMTITALVFLLGCALWLGDAVGSLITTLR
jgi:hypothetical protein